MLYFGIYAIMIKIHIEAFISLFYFQKGFAMLCGFTIGEYVRQRRELMNLERITCYQSKQNSIVLDIMGYK